MNPKKVLLIIMIISILTITACTKYVCYDGTVQKDQDKCPIIQVPSINIREAERAIDTFGQTYAQAKTARFSRINVYREGPNFHAETLFAGIKDEQVHRIKLQVDGKTSTVTCLEGCEYLFGNPESNETNEI